MKNFIKQYKKLTSTPLSLVTGLAHKTREKVHSSKRIDTFSLGIGILSVLYRWYKPIIPLYYQKYDDALYVRYANSILKRNWLGDYLLQGNLTLAKPPGFALFLSLSYIVHIPFTVLVQVLVVISALSILKCLVWIGANKQASSAGYCFTIFSPIWFGFDSSRVYRDSFLASLMLAVIAMTLRMLVCFKEETYKTKKVSFFATAISFGVTISLIRITKNVEFAIYVFIVFNALLLVKNSRKAMAERIKILVIAMGVLIISMNSLTLVVKQLNRVNYGVAITENYTSGQFPKAMSVIASVVDVNQRKYVPITQEMRKSIYRVSPTFRKLERFLELPDGVGWRSQPCSSPLKICDETALWAPWELRDAVVSAGLADNASQFEKTFGDISKEIIRGCKSKMIECGDRGVAPGIGPIREISLRHMVESTSITVRQIFELAGSGGVSASFDPGVEEQEIKFWKETVHGIPANMPLDVYKPGINSGSETLETLVSLYKPMWQAFFLFGVIGFILTSVNRRFHGSSQLFSVAISGLLGGAALCAQIAIAESEMGLFALTSAYYLPVYPFFILFLTLGIGSLLDQFDLITAS